MEPFPAPSKSIVFILYASYLPQISAAQRFHVSKDFFRIPIPPLQFQKIIRKFFIKAMPNRATGIPRRDGIRWNISRHDRIRPNNRAVADMHLHGLAEIPDEARFAPHASVDHVKQRPGGLHRSADDRPQIDLLRLELDGAARDAAVATFSPTASTLSLPGSKTRKTLSEIPVGFTWRPWKWMFVCASSWLSSVSSIVRVVRAVEPFGRPRRRRNRARAVPWEPEGPALRFHIGLEDLDDDYPGELELRMRLSEAGQRTSELTSEGMRFVVGMSGTVGGWDYDTAYNHSVNTVKDREGNTLSYATGSAWAIPADSANPEAACRFMKIMTETDSWMAAAEERVRLREESEECASSLIRSR